MSPELIGILAVGVALAGIIFTGFRRLDSRIDHLEKQTNERFDRIGDRITALDRGQAELRERMAKLEGLLEGLREAISGRREAS